MTGLATDRYYGKATTVPLDTIGTVVGVIRGAWGDYGYSVGVEAAGVGRYVFCCRHADGSEWFLEADRYGNVHETENIAGVWTQGARV